MLFESLEWDPSSKGWACVPVGGWNLVLPELLEVTLKQLPLWPSKLKIKCHWKEGMQGWDH